MNFKTASNHKESTPGKIRKHEEQIAGLVGSLNKYGNPFRGAARSMAAGAEIPGNIINWLPLLLARKYGTERVEQFVKKRLLYQEVSFYDPVQCSSIARSLKKKIENGNICSQRKPPGSWTICWKIPGEEWGIQVSFNNLPTSSLYTGREIVSTKS